ncbi:MMPL family transporter [Dactylosporangium sp. NPDC051541]|uniref:MMPL family transporter n=1 Tax=Dactylosporangium sp. NPDC051541 TaxID=3363977 RepID=UPI003788CD95
MGHGFIARVGQWCFRHRWGVLGIWLAAVVLGVLAAGPVFDALAANNSPKNMESFRGQNVLATQSTQGGTVIGVVDGIDPAAPQVRTDVGALADKLRGVDGVQQVVTPFTDGLPPDPAAGLVAEDHRGLLVQVTLKNLSDDAQDTAASALTDALHAGAVTLREHGQPDARIRAGGGPVINQQANAQAGADLSKSESMSLPITLVVLVFIFGGVIAAGMPVLAAIVSIAFSMIMLLVFTKFTELDSNAVTIVTLLGLGLSIDYGLLLVARYREELAAGFEPQQALGRAWATAGRTIAFSALTVAAALSGLLLFGITGLSALGAAGISVAIAAMLVSLTFTAALLGLARKRIRPSKRAGRRTPDSGFFASLARIVQRRPLLTTLLGGAALVAVALPALGTTLHLDDLGALPPKMESVQVEHELTDNYGQSAAPAVTVVAHLSPAELDTWAARLDGTPGVRLIHPAADAGNGLATIGIEATGDPEGPAARDLVERIRADRPGGGESWVTGSGAMVTDVVGQIIDRLPLALGVTLLAMVVLLFAMTGSVVVPLKAVLMNLVSLGATFGILTAVFQHGFLAEPLGVLTVGGLSPFTVVSVFAFAFGLSMDYEVFLLGRIKEYTDKGHPTDVAVRRGLQHSGRIITSAALLMVIVFGCFVTGEMGGVQQIGLGLAVAVAVDATLVRCVLVPATMTLLGSANWWAPAWLKRLHRVIGLQEKVLDEPAPAPAPAPVSAPVLVSAPAPVLVSVPVPAAAALPAPVLVSIPVAVPAAAKGKRRKSVLVAYTWWLFLGLFGAHHFYLGRKRQGWWYLGTVGFLALGWLADVALLPRYARTTNATEPTVEPARELVHS